MKRWKVRQKVSKKNPGATLEAPYYLEDSSGNGSVKGRPASTNPGSPSQTHRPTRQRHSRRSARGG